MVGHSCALSAAQEHAVDPLLHGPAALQRDVQKKDQVLAAAVPVDHVAAPDGVHDGFPQAGGQLLQLGPLFHGVPLAVHDRTEHQVDGLAAALRHPPQHLVDALEDRIAAHVGPDLLLVLVLVLLYKPHRLVGMLELIAQLL